MSKVMDALKRKLGPLPAWAWLSIFAVVMIVYRGFAKKPSTDPNAPASFEPVPGPTVTTIVGPGTSSQPPAPMVETDPLFRRFAAEYAARKHISLPDWLTGPTDVTTPGAGSAPPPVPVHHPDEPVLHAPGSEVQVFDPTTGMVGKASS
jgi:hypothetical protein